MDHVLDGMIQELSQSFKFNFVDMCRVAHPVLDELGGGIHCFHLCVMVRVVCMLVQQLPYLEDLSGSKAELTLDLGPFDRYLNMPIICYLAKAGSTRCTPANGVLGW